MVQIYLTNISISAYILKALFDFLILKETALTLIMNPSPLKYQHLSKISYRSGLSNILSKVCQCFFTHNLMIPYFDTILRDF